MFSDTSIASATTSLNEQLSRYTKHGWGGYIGLITATATTGALAQYIGSQNNHVGGNAYSDGDTFQTAMHNFVNFYQNQPEVVNAMLDYYGLSHTENAQGLYEQVGQGASTGFSPVIQVEPMLTYERVAPNVYKLTWHITTIQITAASFALHDMDDDEFHEYGSLSIGRDDWGSYASHDDAVFNGLQDQYIISNIHTTPFNHLDPAFTYDFSQLTDAFTIDGTPVEMSNFEIANGDHSGRGLKMVADNGDIYLIGSASGNSGIFEFVNGSWTQTTHLLMINGGVEIIKTTPETTETLNANDHLDDMDWFIGKSYNDKVITTATKQDDTITLTFEDGSTSSVIVAETQTEATREVLDPSLPAAVASQMHAMITETYTRIDRTFEVDGTSIGDTFEVALIHPSETETITV